MSCWLFPSKRLPNPFGPSLCISMCETAVQFVCLSVSLSVCVPVWLPGRPSICLPDYLPSCLFVCPSLCPSDFCAFVFNFCPLGVSTHCLIDNRSICSGVNLPDLCGLVILKMFFVLFRLGAIGWVTKLQQNKVVLHCPGSAAGHCSTWWRLKESLMDVSWCASYVTVITRVDMLENSFTPVSTPLAPWVSVRVSCLTVGIYAQRVFREGSTPLVRPSFSIVSWPLLLP